jgi:hypothetical protein
MIEWIAGEKHPEHGVKVLAYADGAYFFATCTLGLWGRITDAGDTVGPFQPDYWMYIPAPPTK